MKHTSFSYFHKTLRKYRNTQARMVETHTPSLLQKLGRKLDLLRRRLLRLNRAWKLGLSTAALLIWMAPPARAQGLPSSLNLSELDGNNGFVINGINVDDQSGISVSGAGDLNGDGLDDLIIGADRADPNGNSSAGESYVVFGDTTFADSLNLSDLDGTNGFVLTGIYLGDRSGYSVSGVGDLNGDGVDDLIIGAFTAGNNYIGVGESYVIFGDSTFSDSLNLSDLNGNNGFVINGVEINDLSGRSVSGAGDVNGDGLDDLLIGAPSADRGINRGIGESYVVFGNSSFPASFNLSALNGNNGFAIRGIDRYDESGTSVSGAGDVNGDGMDDLIIGAYAADPEYKSYAGECYVVFGDSTFPAMINLSNLNGNNGFLINGIDASDYCGHSVSGAGDLNGDGLDDLLIGAFGADPNNRSYAGESYVVFGDSSFAASLNLSDLDGNNGFVLNGIVINDKSGRSVSDAGDVNGDGMDDLLIGAYKASPHGRHRAGETYVIFGGSPFSASFNLSDLDGNNGIVIKGIDPLDQSGFSVSGTGDVNGDGIDDLIIGARYADPNGNSKAGESYVVFGQRNTTSIAEQIPSLHLELAPNPASDLVSLRSERFAQTAKVEIKLFDLLGRRLPAPYMRIDRDRFQLDLAGLPAGTYLLRVQAEGRLGSVKIVKE